MHNLKSIGLISLSLCLSMLFISCGEIDEPSQNENNSTDKVDYSDYKNDKSLSDVEKKLVGYWGSHCIFADHYILEGFHLEKWYFNSENNVFSSNLYTFKIEVISDDYIFAENLYIENQYSPDNYRFNKRSNFDLAKYFFSNHAEYLYGVRLMDKDG